MRNKRNMVIGIGSVVLIAGLMVIGAQGKDASHAGHGGHAVDSKEAIPKPVPKAHSDLAKHHAEVAANVGAALKHLAIVETAVRTGDKDIALQELGKARHLLMQLRAKAQGGGHGTIKIANVRCPIMGNKINLVKLTAKSTITYKGKTLGVCCPGCIQSWNKLSAAEKEAKFQASLTLPKAKAKTHGDKHAGHNH